MKVNWGALGITIGLLLLAASILTVGWAAGRKLSALTVGLTATKAAIKRTIIAQEYAFTKADSQRRAISLEDLKEGYALADKFMAK